jgi:drug/metabolite transporter (DMT)-like permease|tara:strand:+ start:858 stop:1763 length:906 start_codon:yes stop_codon:yes gene_type:complete
MNKTEYNNAAVAIVLIAGILWSFGALVVRYIENAHLIPWQYLFFRGLTIFILLNVYLFIKEGKSFTENYKKIDLSVVIGGMGFATAFIGFIWSITHTSAAVTLLMLAAMPFMTAILGYIFLKEKVSATTLTAIIIAAIGIIFMAFSSSKVGTLFGLLLGLLSSLGFSVGSVSLRWNKRTPTFTTVALAGLFCAIISFAMLLFSESDFFTTFRNSSLSALHGTLVCSGLILYSIGSKHLPAADLTLLSLTEVLGGIFWVWLPIFGINEVPTANTIIGGFVITFAIIYYSLNTKRNRRFIGLN